jgi:trimeric autotransporter adhesin
MRKSGEVVVWPFVQGRHHYSTIRRKNMHRIVFTKFITFVALVLACCLSASLIQAQTTAFTYQGRLTDSSLPANGAYDFQFKLFDAVSAGTQIGSTLAPTNVAVSSGLFTVSLDFGAAAFPGANRWLEISVRVAGGGTFTTLTPRQPLTSTPYAIKSLNAAAADSLSAACVNCVTSAQIGSLPANSSNYIQNTNSLQASSNFSISGNGTAGGTLNANIVNATTQFNLSANRILSAAGTSNLFAGVGAGTANTGVGNAFFGAGAGNANTSGNNNAAFGTGAGAFNTIGGFNSFFGNSAGIANTTGNGNSFFGQVAGHDNTGGSNNAFFGLSAGFANVSGNGNSFYGNSAGQTNTTGSNNTIIGNLTNVASGNLSFATALGAGAVVSTNNTVVLGRAADTVQVPGNLLVSGSVNSAWRTETTAFTPNLIGGFLGTGGGGATPGNRVTAGVVGATIGGGGFNGSITFPSSSFPTPGDNANRVTDWFGTVGGGFRNRAGNDNGALGDAMFATVGGGSENTASGGGATVGGGNFNTASGGGSTIGGGSSHTATGESATIGGGYINSAGANGTVSGGVGNAADGFQSSVGGGVHNVAGGESATVGGGDTNTANGNNAAIGGGKNNSAGSISAAVSGGFNNSASGAYSAIPGGRDAKATHYGELAFASSSISSPGDAQTSVYTLTTITSSAASVEMFLDSASTERITLAAGRALSFDVLLVAKTAAGQAAGYRFTGVIKNHSGTTSLVGTVTKTVLAEDDSTWDANVTADNTTDALKISVNGPNTATRWVATVRTSEVQF